MEEVARIGIYIVVMAYSCILHECAHVWVALKLGDPTGKMEGRLTLNPIPHIDPFWTILLPILTYKFAHCPIGGPKPAPVNPLNFRDPRAGYMWTALAGPATNIVLSVAGLAFLWLLRAVAPGLVQAEPGEVSWNALFFANIILTNAFLAAFNLIPVPPLDGSRFLRYILGRSGEGFVDWIERLGFIPVFIAAYFLAPYALVPVITSLHMLLAHLFGGKYAGALVMAYFGR